MSCLELPPFPPLPALPPGVSIPVFTPPALPENSGLLCCTIPIPSFPIPAAVLTIPFPAAVITALNTITKAVQAYYDEYTTFSINCPFS